MLRVVAFVCVLAIGARASSFSPDRMHYIDNATVSTGMTNYLFRGDLPVLSNHTFAYSELLSSARSVAMKEAGIALPASMFLVVVSFLNPLELKDEKVEKKWIEEHPSLAEYHDWPIVGDLTNPESYAESIRKEMAKKLDSWQIDKVPKKMDSLRGLLETTGNQSRLVYIHCEAGMDRTGEMSGSYYMRFLNMTFEKALAIDNSVETRTIHKASQNGMQWYCNFLKYTGMQAWQDCKNTTVVAHDLNNTFE